MLQFYANVIAALCSFVLPLWISRSGIVTLARTQTDSALLVASGIALHMMGPNPVAFGLFLGSGWRGGFSTIGLVQSSSNRLNGRSIILIPPSSSDSPSSLN
jgi:hypothetical protein